MSMKKSTISILVSVVVIMVTMMLSSCVTKKRIAEKESVKTEISDDSINTKKSSVDSTKSERVFVEKDTKNVNTETTVEKSDSTVITVDEKGNVKKTETWHNRSEKTKTTSERERILTDSLSVFKSRVDTLSAYVQIYKTMFENNSNTEKTTIERKVIPKWCYISLAICLVLIIISNKKFVRWLIKI